MIATVYTKNYLTDLTIGAHVVMLGYIDWIIILIALVMTAIGLWFLLSPQNTGQESQQLRVLRLQAENDRKHIAQTLEITQNGAKDAESLLAQLKTQLDQANRTYQASQARAEQAERIIERVSSAEHEIRDISTQLGNQLNHMQNHWDGQLSESVESIKRIRSKLYEGLTQVDDSITRLREQEKMAQTFTRKLIEHQQSQAVNQQENARLSAEVHDRLETMLKESSHLLEQMKNYQHDADQVFQQFTATMEGLETQANDHFNTLYQSSDLARHELKAGLEESRQHVETMRRREEQSNELSRLIHQQFEQIDHIRVERIAKTLDMTEQMSSDLHQGMENARDMLSSLEHSVRLITTSLQAKEEETTPELITEAHKTTDASGVEEPAVAQAANTEDLDTTPKVDNLVSLKAYRN